MANIKSAKKRISTIERRNSENRYVRATLNTMAKKFRKMLEEGKVEEAEKYSRDVYAYIDSACSKGVIHKNAASRKVGRLASALYKAKANNVETKVEKKEEVKVEAKVEEPKTEKKVEAKKTTRKTATKKATEEKPAAEKKTTTRKSTKTAEEKPTTEKKSTRKTATKKAE